MNGGTQFDKETISETKTNIMSLASQSIAVILYLDDDHDLKESLDVRFKRTFQEAREAAELFIMQSHPREKLKCVLTDMMNRGGKDRVVRYSDVYRTRYVVKYGHMYLGKDWEYGFTFEMDMGEAKKFTLKSDAEETAEKFIEPMYIQEIFEPRNTGS